MFKQSRDFYANKVVHSRKSWAAFANFIRYIENIQSAYAAFSYYKFDFLLFFRKRDLMQRRNSILYLAISVSRNSKLKMFVLFQKSRQNKSTPMGPRLIVFRFPEKASCTWRIKNTKEQSWMNFSVVKHNKKSSLRAVKCSKCFLLLLLLSSNYDSL